jgi:hypothetical protein
MFAGALAMRDLVLLHRYILDICDTRSVVTSRGIPRHRYNRKSGVVVVG